MICFLESFLVGRYEGNQSDCIQLVHINSYSTRTSWVSISACKIILQYKKCTEEKRNMVKGIVSRDFGGLHMILMNRIVVPDVPLDVYLFLNFRFHIVF